MMQKLLLCAFALVGLGAADTPAPAGPDPLYSQQWALHNDGTQPVILKRDGFSSNEQMGVPGTDIGYAESKAAVAQLAKTPVIVAVIDSGLDVTHPEFSGRIADGGFNFVADQPKDQTNLTDLTGHGTETAGVIVANADNAIGISGITPPTVKVLPLAVLGSAGNAAQGVPPTYVNFVHNHKLISDYVADAIRYAVAHKANVINMSLAWPKLADTDNVRKAVQEAQAAGVMLIAASGNDNKDSNPFPCAYDGVVCVGAISNNGTMAYYSNYGAGNDVLAPGDYIVSTLPIHPYLPSMVLGSQGYDLVSGTSIATPHVSALAAILKSAYPNISMSEWKARIFASGGKLPTNGALFGLINIERALDAKPQAVYYPHFKLVGNLPIDENTLQVSSSIAVENLWGVGANVKAQVTVNGKAVGQAQATTLAQNQTLTVPWSYKLSSLTDSSLLHLQLKITDAAGANKTYTMDVIAARTVAKIAKQQVIAMPTAPLAWVGLANGIPYSVLNVVNTYGFEPGLPKYYTVMNPQNNPGLPAPIVQIFDPSKPNSGNSANTNQLTLNGLQQVNQVMRIDVARSGHFSWLIIGAYSVDKDHTYMQFRFLDDGFQPLFGTAADSIWQIQLSGSLGAQVVSRSYATPGSWVMSKGKLVPAFFMTGSLPKPDNYTSRDQQFTDMTNHLYYMSEIAQPMPLLPAQSNVTNFELRALDSATFRNSFTEINLQNLIPPSNTDMMAGHLRIVALLGHDTLAPTAIVDVPSIEAPTTTNAPAWDLYSAIGSPYYIQTQAHAGQTSSFVDQFSDNARGSLTWISSDGDYLGRTGFTYSSMLDPIVSPGLLGIFELPNTGRVWFVESQFSLIAFYQSPQELNTAANPQMSTFAIDRDSTYSTDQYAQQFTPALLGTADNPQSSIYMDLTLVRGDYVTAVTWNTTSHELEKMARYSFTMPANCAHMPPLRAGYGVDSFSIPMFCQVGQHIEYRIVEP